MMRLVRPGIGGVLALLVLGGVAAGNSRVAGGRAQRMTLADMKQQLAVDASRREQ